MRYDLHDILTCAVVRPYVDNHGSYVIDFEFPDTGFGGMFEVKKNHECRSKNDILSYFAFETQSLDLQRRLLKIFPTMIEWC